MIAPAGTQPHLLRKVDSERAVNRNGAMQRLNHDDSHPRLEGTHEIRTRPTLSPSAGKDALLTAKRSILTVESWNRHHSRENRSSPPEIQKNIYHPPRG